MTLPTLHDHSVQWLLNEYHTISKPKVIKQAFASCHAVPSFNLSFDSLMSCKALQRLRDVQKNEPDIWIKILTYQYKFSEQHGVVDADEEPAFTDNTDTLDGSDVAIKAILQHIADGSQGPLAGYSVDPSNGSLIIHNKAEVYKLEVAGHAQAAEALNMGEGGEESKEIPGFGRGQHRRTVNTLYNDFWSH
ncbi:uncharacterized protein HD556DRAFT_1448519 [Suillus plorans]|uniref:Uncharacterized protein n=1 Tax=Suillus plorans TaxID=116603 RepID=A0A9P7AG92_9AGAM|nr:uncharacterized protein HD556DRAFT_1448519 [Suillus plorans]KAG1787671.1 hypothetical protein HD556DRAFT_1448519 [Suillus plorans]